MELTSTAFADGEPIPREYGYTGRNVNPPLSVRSVPEGTETLALLVDDPDAREPAGKVWDHWVVWNLPADIEEIPEGFDPATVGATAGQNDFGEHGYGGPNPPDREHCYRFRLYATDRRLELDPNATKADVENELAGTVLDSVTLEGTYAPG
jgi:Raf kinase inhibitor-like YbhB/YbcL family protein